MVDNCSADTLIMSAASSQGTLTRELHLTREKCKLLSPANALHQPKPSRYWLSGIQANGKMYVELHPRTYVEFATKRHDFSQLNQKTELVRLASHCWRLGQLSWWNKRLGLGTLPH
jgi:hypothetical protein